MEVLNQKITILDVAQHARVSPGTVSRVLNNVPNVDGNIKQRVLLAIKDLGYIHIPKRRIIRSSEGNGKSLTQLNSIVMCAREMETPISRNIYYSHVLHGAEVECTYSNVNMIYCSVKDKPTSLWEIEAVIGRGKADGLLLVGLNNRTLIEKVSQLDIPVVLVNNHLPDLPVDSIICNFSEGIKLSMQYLSRLGHYDIIFIGGPAEDYSARVRLEGYRISLIQSNIEYRPELVFESDMTIGGAEEIAKRILKSGLKYSAICCANDGTAIGVIRVFTAAGIKIPQDVSVIGFDDIDVAALISPPLTTIHTDIEALGRLAVERLIGRLNRPGRFYQQTMLGVKLIERASTTYFQG